MVGPEEILSFWLDEIGPQGWFKSEDALDAEMRARFEETWDGAMEGKFGLWLTYPSGALAYIILMDQFPRNMFRGTAKSFASDPVALAAAKQAIHRGWDLKIDEPAREFFYKPLMHSENLYDQDRCVRLTNERMQQSENNLLHAKAHREVIRLFGRFPGRNAALDRKSTTPELVYVDEGGYGRTVRSLQQPA